MAGGGVSVKGERERDKEVRGGNGVWGCACSVLEDLNPTVIASVIPDGERDYTSQSINNKSRNILVLNVYGIRFKE